MSDYVRLCQIMSDYVRLCQIMSEYVRLCQIMSDYVKLCQIMSNYVSLCQIMSGQDTDLVTLPVVDHAGHLALVILAEIHSWTLMIDELLLS